MVLLRKAVMEDMDLIYEWANDPVVRQNSFHSDPIPYEVHKAWFQRIMSDASVLQFIMMEEDIPVGQIRLNVDDDEAEISYSIGDTFRGKGYGHKILQLIAELVKKEYPEIRNLIAKVKPGNDPSNKLFETENYEMSYLCYSKCLD